MLTYMMYKDIPSCTCIYVYMYIYTSKHIKFTISINGFLFAYIYIGESQYDDGPSNDGAKDSFQVVIIRLKYVYIH
jgi:hypothetical protein